jgi:hypothetical protein
MSTRVVIGGDFRALLNALSHGDEAGVGQFLPFRKGASGLHLAEALGLASASLSRPEQVALALAGGAKLSAADTAAAAALSVEQRTALQQRVRIAVVAVLDWFSAEKTALVADLRAGGSLERQLVVIGDPVREAIAAQQFRAVLGSQLTPPEAETPVKKGGFFARLFGRG